MSNRNNFSFYWHDYETFGVVPRVDRPSQFAGIRTDADFNIIGEPLMIYCQPPEDYLPQPEACLLTGITPQIAQERGIPEPEFAAQVHAELSKPGTCGVGYNSMRFDDEVSRFTFWRNFIDPYKREWADGCGRWDIIDMVRMTYALRPDGIEWPTHDDGKPSFRLEQLTAANGLSHEQAHDALSDVHATIALAKLIKTKQPKLYDFAMSMRPKAKVASLLDLVNKPAVVHVSARFPADKGCLAVVMPLAAHPTNKNSVICYDLGVDPSPLLELDVAQIRQRLFVSTAELPSGVDRIPLKEIHLNKTPVVAPLNTLKGQPMERWRISLGRIEKHREALLNAPELEWKLHQVYSNQAFTPLDDPEHKLYDGFVGSYDRDQCERVRKASAEELEDLNPVFQDDRLTTLLFRYKARHFPSALTEEEKTEWQAHVKKALMESPYGLSLEGFMGEVIKLKQRPGLSQAQKDLLQGLAKWGLERGQAVL